MMDGFSSFSDLYVNRLANGKFFINHFKNDCSDYLGHLSKIEDGDPELLTEHINRVNVQALRTLSVGNLESVIDGIISSIARKIGKNGDPEFIELLKTAFLAAIEFHDYGKTNPAFQYEKMDVTSFKTKQNPFKSTHAELGSLYFLEWGLELFDKYKTDSSIFQFLITYLLCLKSCISLHHSSEYSPSVEFQSSRGNKLSSLKEDLNNFSFETNRDFLKVIWHEKDQQVMAVSFLHKINSKHPELAFDLFLLIRLNFSLLTASDQIATFGYMQQMEQHTLPLPLKTLSVDHKEHMRSVFKKHPDHTYNADIINNTEELSSKSIEQFTERSKDNLNKLRSVLAANALQALRNNPDERLFFLEAPTGSGKTNISMLLLHHLFKEDPSVERIFYVFPFTTLADQTMGEFKDRFGLSNQDVTALHSKAFHTYSNKSGDEDDAEYGKDKAFYLHDLFGNEAITLTSHVTFWNMLKSNRKQDIYRFCQLTNSVVIFDEIQAYPPEHWDKINFFLEEATERLNMRCIVMSATLPDIGALSMQEKQKNTYTRLISQEKRDLFFTNPNFGNRVEMISEEDRVFDGSANALAEFITSRTEECTEEDQWNGIRVIVECIKKATATQLYQEFQDIGSWDDSDLLSGTILEPERHKILDKLKGDKIDGEKYVLVTTQVVEAGVNIDMDIGFKDSSLLDSDEQLAGRINRNAANQPSKLFLFNFDDAKHIYGKDKRLKVPKEQPGITEKFRKDKDFKSYYQHVLNEINRYNEIDVIGGLSDYKNHFRTLDYNSIHNRFKIIDSDTLPVFIPLSYHIENDLNYDYQISSIIKELDHTLNLVDGDHLSGEKVWQAFRSVTKEKQDFIIQNKQIKQLLPLVNLFTFPVYNDSKLLSQLREFSHHEEDTVDRNSRGYIYLHRWDEVYDRKEGLTLNEETMDACRIL